MEKVQFRFCEALEEDVEGFTLVRSENSISGRRWHNSREQVWKRDSDNTHWSVCFSTPATEMQDWEYDGNEMIDAVQVQAYIVEKVEYRPIKGS